MKRKLLFILLLLSLFQILTSSVVIYFAAVSLSKANLERIGKRVVEDIKYENGKWDTYLYNSDPQLPGTYPLYVLSSEGFVIERWKPVKGYMDTSDFKHLLEFTTPQTINTITNQNWRILSKPILDQERIIGVITVSSFNPSEAQLPSIDNQLNEALNIISSKIKINKGEIDVTDLDIRQIRYETTFQIVNQYHHIVAKSNNSNSIDRLPNFIDPSYVLRELNSESVKIIKDVDTNEKFLVKSSSISDSNNNIVGIVIAGTSIEYAFVLLSNFLKWQFVSLTLLLSLLFLIEPRLKLLNLSSLDETKNLRSEDIKKISFLKDSGELIIGDSKIKIPYATFQYYLCEILFSSPKKRVEYDEILERFGEEAVKGNWRKVYDTANLINKKVYSILGTRLIHIQNKTYFINPSLLPKIK